MSEESENQKDWGAVKLFVRTDERMENVEAAQHDIKMEQASQKERIAALDVRIEKAVSFGTAKNTAEIGELKAKVMEATKSVEHFTIQLNDPETGFFKNVKVMKESVDRLYQGILAVFFGTIVTAFIIYLLKHAGLLK